MVAGVGSGVAFGWVLRVWVQMAQAPQHVCLCQHRRGCGGDPGLPPLPWALVAPVFWVSLLWSCLTGCPERALGVPCQWFPLVALDPGAPGGRPRCSGGGSVGTAVGLEVALASGDLFLL